MSETTNETETLTETNEESPEESSETSVDSRRCELKSLANVLFTMCQESGDLESARVIVEDGNEIVTRFQNLIVELEGEQQTSPDLETEDVPEYNRETNDEYIVVNDDTFNIMYQPSPVISPYYSTYSQPMYMQYNVPTPYIPQMNVSPQPYSVPLLNIPARPPLYPMNTSYTPQPSPSWPPYIPSRSPSQLPTHVHLPCDSCTGHHNYPLHRNRRRPRFRGGYYRTSSRPYANQEAPSYSAMSSTQTARSPDNQPVVIVTRNVCDCKKKQREEESTQTSTEFVSSPEGPQEQREHQTPSSWASRSPKHVSPNRSDSKIKLGSSASSTSIQLTDEKEFPPLDLVKVELPVHEKKTFSEVAEAMSLKQATSKPVIIPPTDSGKMKSLVPKNTRKKVPTDRAGYRIEIMERFCINVDKIFSEGEKKVQPVAVPKPEDGNTKGKYKTKPKEGWQLVTSKTRNSSYRRPSIFDALDENETTLETLGTLPDYPELVPSSAAEVFFQQYVDYLDNLASSDQDEELDKFERSKQTEERSSSELVLYPDTCCIASFEAFILEHPIEAESLQKDLGNKIQQIKFSETKHRMAQQKRKQIVEGKTAKARGIMQKVQEVKAAKTRLALERKTQIFEKLKKAEEKRNKYLSYIRKKAHNEEEKLKEIAFINELEAQNRRHDSLALRQEHEERLQCILEGRQRRIEEKAAKEAAAEERRRAIEYERQEKLLKIAEERKIKEEKIEEKQEKRLVLAKEKARKRDDRLTAYKCKSALKKEQLKAQISKKMEDAAGRHDQDIEQKRMRASASGVHKSEESPPVEDTGAQALRTNDEDIKFPEGLDKKEFKKLKLKIAKKSSNYLESPGISAPMNSDVQILLVKIAKQTPIQSRLAEIVKFMEKLEKLSEKILIEFPFFDRTIDGFLILCGIISDLSSQFIGERQLILLNKVFSFLNVVIASNLVNLVHFINSNCLITIVTTINKLLEVRIETDPTLWASTTIQGIDALTKIHRNLDMSSANTRKLKSIITTEELLNFFVSCGLVQKIQIQHREEIIAKSDDSMDLHGCFYFVYQIFVYHSGQLKAASDCIKQTDCFNCVRFLYEAVQRCDYTEPGCIEKMGINNKLFLLMELAEHNFDLFKEIMATDGVALQLRGIISSLLIYSTGQDEITLVEYLLRMIAFFGLCSSDYKVLLQSGNQPTVLNQLVNIDFKFLANFFPSLYSTLYILGSDIKTNRDIIRREFSFSAIRRFVEDQLKTSTSVLSSLTADLFKNNPVSPDELESDSE